MSPRGTAHLKQWEADLIAEREAAAVVTRCSFCCWTHDGPMGEGRDLYAVHRADKHPDVKPVERRRRHRPFGAMLTGKPLEDNIANAREQGAATWAG